MKLEKANWSNFAKIDEEQIRRFNQLLSEDISKLQGGTDDSNIQMFGILN